jgi:DNA-binding CsgD family transcriptional regulator
MADERVLDLVSDIYEAALDATRWPAVLNSVGDAVGGPIVVYGLYDPASALAQIYAPRVDPEHVRRFDDWIGRAPAMPCIGNYAPGQVFSGSDVVIAEDFVRTDFYHECWLPAGLSTTPLVTNLLSGDAASGHVATHMPANASFSDDQRRLFAALAQHLVHAASLQRRVHHLDLAGRSALSRLDGLNQGFALVDASARPLLVNRTAQALLETEDGLRLEAGVLSASAADEGRALQGLIAMCADRRSVTQGGRIALWRKPDRLPLDVLISPVQPSVTEHMMLWSSARAAAAIVLISDPEADIRARADELRERFGLTPAEATLALEIAKGDGRKATADRLGITVGTVRCHLSNIFDKTGVRHQAELVRLLLQR